MSKLVQLKDGDGVNVYPVASNRSMMATYTEDTYGITIPVKRYGDLCILGSFTYSAELPKSTWISCCTLDSDYRPPFTMPYQTIVAQNDPEALLLVSINSNGLVRINAINKTIPTGRYFNSFVTYPAAH